MKFKDLFLQYLESLKNNDSKESAELKENLISLASETNIVDDVTFLLNQHYAKTKTHPSELWHFLGYARQNLNELLDAIIHTPNFKVHLAKIAWERECKADEIDKIVLEFKKTYTEKIIQLEKEAIQFRNEALLQSSIEKENSAQSLKQKMEHKIASHEDRAVQLREQALKMKKIGKLEENLIILDSKEEKSWIDWLLFCAIDANNESLIDFLINKESPYLALQILTLEDHILKLFTDLSRNLDVKNEEHQNRFLNIFRAITKNKSLNSFDNTILCFLFANPIFDLETRLFFFNQISYKNKNGLCLRCDSDMLITIYQIALDLIKAKKNPDFIEDDLRPLALINLIEEPLVSEKMLYEYKFKSIWPMFKQKFIKFIEKGSLHEQSEQFRTFCEKETPTLDSKIELTPGQKLTQFALFGKRLENTDPVRYPFESNILGVMKPFLVEEKKSEKAKKNDLGS